MIPLRLFLQTVKAYGGVFPVLIRLARRVALRLFAYLQMVVGLWRREARILLIAPGISDDDLADLAVRKVFYVPSRDWEIRRAEIVSLVEIFSSTPVLYFGDVPKLEKMAVYRPAMFNVDFRRNPMDGWEWCSVSEHCAERAPDYKAAQQRFMRRVALLHEKGLKRCYVFGTGPSLAKALDREWEDGYKVVCNTIVRDKELWQHLKPDFIAAGDAIYHFGFTEHACAFRRDLRDRLAETNTLFVYPGRFHELVRREFDAFSEQLVPFPIGWYWGVNVDLTRNFCLPNMKNVLPLLLLPLACTLARQVYLWGFDGRAPNDVLFWSNSPRHSYPEYMPQLQKAHPRFFDHHVPEKDPGRYVRDVHGDTLEKALALAEQQGWRFIMMHPSWTPVLQKRYCEGRDR